MVKSEEIQPGEFMNLAVWRRIKCCGRILISYKAVMVFAYPEKKKATGMPVALNGINDERMVSSINSC